MNTAVLSGAVDFRRAFLINLVSSTGGVVTRLVLSLLLARLLRPAELGLYALGLAIFSVAQLLRDAGISAYVQREPDLTAARFSACLGLLASTTLAATLALWLLAEPLARQFGQPGLAEILHVLSLGLLLSPFAAAMVGLQLRELAAGPMAFAARIGMLSQAGVSLLLSADGWGALGLAWAQVITVCVWSLVYVLAWTENRNWRPSRRGWGEVLRFGLGATFVGMLNGVNGVLPDLLLSQLGSARQVGLLGRASAAVGLLQSVAGQALSFGALPLLASQHARGETLEPALRRATALLTGLGWPLLALTVAYREPLVHLLYGPAWADCTPAVLPLALAAASSLMFVQFNAALAAVGRPGLAAAPTVVVLAARVGLGLAWFDGSLLSFAWAMCAADAMALPLQLWLAARHLGQPPRALLAAVGGSAVAALAVVAVPWALAPLAWAAALQWSRHPLLNEAVQLVRRRHA
ncbi:MAG TPA: oligosaccharide flippase family protein [Roseateles sp.]